MGAAEEAESPLHQPVGHSERHALEARGVRHAKLERATRAHAIVRRLHLVFDRRKLRVAFGFEQLVVAPVLPKLLSFLRVERACFFLQAGIVDDLERVANRIDQKRLDIRHRQRRAVDHVAPLGLVGFPVRLDVVRKLERDATDDDLAGLRQPRRVGIPKLSFRASDLAMYVGRRLLTPLRPRRLRPAGQRPRHAGCPPTTPRSETSSTSFARAIPSETTNLTASDGRSLHRKRQSYYSYL